MDTRPPVYEEEGITYYRASSIGMCVRGLVAARLGMPGVAPSEKRQKDMDAGTQYEPIALTKLQRMGYDVGHRQERFELPVAEGVEIRGHIDAVATTIGTRGTTSYVVEVKSLAPSTFRAWRARHFETFPQWSWQISAAMHATGLAGLLVAADRTTGALSCLDMAEPPWNRRHVELRVQAVENLAREGDLGPCLELFPCSYFYLHDCPVLTPARTPEHVRVVLREAFERSTGGFRERMALRLAEVGE